MAATWQLTILATPVVLLLFGRRVSFRAVLFTFILFAGVAATSLFLGARHMAKSPSEPAAADCTQPMEVVFTLAAEALLLGGALPGLMGWAGIALTLLVLVLYLQMQKI